MKNKELLQKRGVVFLQSQMEYDMYSCYMLSVESNGFGATINAMVVDKYTQKYGYDFIEFLQACKSFL